MADTVSINTWEMLKEFGFVPDSTVRFSDAMPAEF
jgi:hypothetical protein